MRIELALLRVKMLLKSGLRQIFRNGGDEKANLPNTFLWLRNVFSGVP
jgi:hypothetical protein